MDWRERKYYLVDFNDSTLHWWDKGHDDYGVRYSNYCNMLKQSIPSIKISKPYNHFKNCRFKPKYAANYYDGDVPGIFYTQMMISCRKEHCDLFESMMNEIKEHDKYTGFKEITKEMCGQ